MKSNAVMKYLLLMVCLICPCCLSAQTEENAYIRRGNTQFKQDKFADADVNYRKALELNPTNSRARYNLGNALLSQRKPKDAMKEYEEAVKTEKNPFFKAAIYHNMGVILQSQKQFAQAIECYKESLRNYSIDDRTRYNLALCQYQLKKNPNNQQQDNNKQNEDEKTNEKDDQQKQKQQQHDQHGKEQLKNQMSKENAEQMLRAAMMEENKTQQKVRQAQQQRQKNVEKNW